ncbi:MULTISPECIES: MucB/RseB C-terminal domain-containing protein [Silvimonas]|uniref:MucB/RseB C-terminal domain-containing protein n=1 Tax=Silvimonas TaxID=300264 RepID=UPI0024B3877D|nr:MULTISPECIES: MucB/RseB C-terminal domain-containing protein [Silvimonas]MDR3428327.1 MucB/RseB C-terminal domain-containing protein [Silvimonas sp.]
MMKTKGWILAGSLFLAGQRLLAASLVPNELLSQQDATQLVARVANAAKTVSFQGVYVHQHGDNMEAFRVIHEAASGNDIERRESLDGPPREFFRQGNQVSLYLPGGQVFPIDRRQSSKLFPRQFPDDADHVLVNYQVRFVGQERVAGQDANIYDFEPRDKLRYPHRYWVHPETGLMLKSVMLGIRREPVEVFAFSQVQIGGPIDRRLLKPTYPVKPAPVDDSNGPVALPKDTGWDIHNLPNGFRLLKVGQRPMTGKPKPVIHHLYGDGLVTLSVFIEPFDASAPLGIAQQAGITVFARQAGPYLLTVLGEVPPETVQAFSYAYTPKGEKAGSQ